VGLSFDRLGPKVSSTVGALGVGIGIFLMAIAVILYSLALFSCYYLCLRYHFANKMMNEF
jgi:hypothetical protein